jgi:c-di-GMP-binding flagellar brake protein YcgR
MVNLRRYARLRVEVDVDYPIIGAAKARKARTKSCDISIGGICFEAPDRCKVGARVNLEIFLERDDPVKVEGNVIWHKKFEDGTCRAGVSFVDLKEEDRQRFSNFIFRKMYEMTGVGDRSGLVKYAKEHGWKAIKE